MSDAGARATQGAVQADAAAGGGAPAGDLPTADARRVLLGGLIDYAGLFPPAALDVPAAVAEFAGVRAHRHGWLVDRFVAGAAVVEGVGEVAAAQVGGDAAVPAAGGGAAGAVAAPGADLCHAAPLPWRVALVVEAPVLRAAGEAAGRVRHAVHVDVVELRPLAAADIAGAVEAARIVFPGAEVHAEVLAGDEAALDAIAASGARAKLRCGGERVPGAEEVAQVLRGCAERGLVLKGTAGLHHPVAAEGRHGFLNLLAAAALGGEPDAVRETDPSAFSLTADGFSWRGRPIDPATARGRFSGFGSCSFAEPVEDLVALGVLP